MNTHIYVHISAGSIFTGGVHMVSKLRVYKLTLNNEKRGLHLGMIIFCSTGRLVSLVLCVVFKHAIIFLFHVNKFTGFAIIPFLVYAAISIRDVFKVAFS